jgi:methylated-DNA-[protein]-cysteine S-methyltransferase
MTASMVELCRFDTKFGPCAIAWSRRGVCGVQLPERTAAATSQRLLERFPGASESVPPADIRRVIDDIGALLDGESSDLTGVTLDESGVPEFHRRVYAVARTIAPGATLTYGEIAARLGEPGSARAVGQALGQNPCPIIVPCHRVLAAGGRAGGFSAAGGVSTKLKLLEIERSRRPFELT